ncbi:hypothetical protein [Rhizobium tropici]|uniref:hypothetical protein n=1 Tax=Rhizobium tropici TaxID=398 RepID=UPI00165EC723|nr:hypothetical protein [Rhizobium tropici]
MTSTFQFAPSDRLLPLAAAFLLVATLAAGIQTHAFCSIFCVHGDHMIASEICAHRSQD